MLLKIIKKIYHTLFDFQLNVKREFSSKKRISKHTNINYINNEKIIVVFIQTYPAAWNTVKSLYQHMLSDERFHPIVVAVPVMDHTRHCLSNKAFKALNEQGINVVNAYDEKLDTWLDLQTLNPNFVFYNRPYDTEIIYKPYKSVNVSLYSNVCFLHYGYALSSEYQKFWKNDTLIYNCRLIFSDNTTRYTEHTRVVDKELKKGLVSVYNIGYPRFDIYADCREANEKNRESKYKKVFLWTPRWATEQRNPDKSTFTIYYRYLIEYFKNNSQYKLIIRPHPKMFDDMILRGIMTEAQVDNIKQEISICENIELDESSDYLTSIMKCDVVISDYTALLIEYAVACKKIIYCGSADHFNKEGNILMSAFCVCESWDQLLSSINKDDIPEYVEKDIDVLSKLNISTDGNISSRICSVLEENRFI